jgi:tetratricopeptide (TPR) repeat protein
MQSPTDFLSFPADPDELLRTARADAAAGCWSDLRELLADRESECRVRPELAVLLAEAEMRLGNPRATRDLLTEFIPLLEQVAPLGESLRNAVNLLGAALFALGDIADAERAFWRAVDMARAAGDLLRVARAANNLGAIANLRGRHQLALTLYELAMSVYEGKNATTGIAETYHNMAITYRDLHDFNRAEEYELHALAFANEADELRVQQMARVGLAELMLLRGNPSAADDQATRAALVCALEVDAIGEADALRLVGEARAALGAKEEALDAFDRAVTLARRQGYRLVEAEALQARATLRRSMRMSRRADEDETMAGEILRRMQGTGNREPGTGRSGSW